MLVIFVWFSWYIQCDLPPPLFSWTEGGSHLKRICVLMFVLLNESTMNGDHSALLIGSPSSHFPLLFASEAFFKTFRLHGKNWDHTLTTLKLKKNLEINSDLIAFSRKKTWKKVITNFCRNYTTISLKPSVVVMTFGFLCLFERTLSCVFGKKR